MLLGVKKNNKNCYTITNYTIKNDYDINGGLQKLINHITETHKPSVLKVFIDKRWNNSIKFTSLGFNYVNDTKPTFYYIDKRHRTSTKPKNGNVHKIYDCGKELFCLEF